MSIGISLIHVNGNADLATFAARTGSLSVQLPRGGFDASGTLDSAHATPLHTMAVTPIPLRATRLMRLSLHLARGLAEVGFRFARYNDAEQRAAVQRWSLGVLRILNVQLDQRGTLDVAFEADTPRVLVANHISWLDVFVMNALHGAHFVAKAEVQRWPLIGWLAARSGTLFISREKRHDTARVNAAIITRLNAGAPIAIFPEGGTTDGRNVAKFHASLLQPAIEAGARVQPIALRYRQPDGSPCDAAVYIGDTSLVTSVLRILSQRTLHVEVHCLPALDGKGQQRRQLAEAVRTAICQAITPAPNAPAAATVPHAPHDSATISP